MIHLLVGAIMLNHNRTTNITYSTTNITYSTTNIWNNFTIIETLISRMYCPSVYIFYFSILYGYKYAFEIILLSNIEIKFK